jgi:hypothetical protein
MDERRTLDDTPPTAADALEIIERAQSRVGRLLHPNAAVFYAIWGVVWLVLGTAAWADAHGWLGAGGAVVGIVSAVVSLVGVAASIVIGVRGGRGVRSGCALRGRLYGASWVISFGGLTLLLVGLPLPDATVLVLYPAAYVFLAGALYLAGGALWQDVPQYVLGTWTIAVAVVSVFAGYPANSLVMAIGGGGGLLVTAAYLQRRAR